MFKRKMLYTLLAVFLCLSSSHAVTIDEDFTPIVGDWKDAVNAKGLIRIPVQNPYGLAWFVSLRMGTKLQEP